MQRFGRNGPRSGRNGPESGDARRATVSAREHRAHFGAAMFALLVGCSASDGRDRATPNQDGGPPRAVCSSSEPDGDCPPDQRCSAGKCVSIPECARDPGEPNDVRARATPLPIDVEFEGRACEDDIDWFRVEVPPGQVVTVVATTPKPRTNQHLDAYAYQLDGTPLGGLWQGKEPHPDFALANQTAEQGFGFYGTDAGATYFVKVVPRTPSDQGSYRIIAQATPWKDGPTCALAGFSDDECIGGVRGKQTLWMFPFMNASDSYVGAGYVFDVFSNYRYLRRETMMLVRYAMHEVSRQFPGTKPLGLADMCQRDAITPGYDVKKPRHPATSHDQGGNIDVAYYSTLADNHVRVMCDPKGGSQTPDGYYCLDSAATTHVIDLPRTVYFVVALARDPRFRVAGVDRVLGPIMQQEAERMRDAGTITTIEFNAYVKHVTWGDGWPAHHHHLHLSMQWL